MSQTASPQPAKPEKLLRLPEVESLTGLKKSSIYAGMGASPPTFPNCIRLSARAVAWRESDILAWQALRNGGTQEMRERILDRLTKGPATASQLEAECLVTGLPARINELSEAGHLFETKVIDQTGADGKAKRVTVYKLRGQ